jgi:hypothetical protein
VSRFLGRVLARTVGRAPGSLQAPRPQRRSAQAGDPFAAHDAADAPYPARPEGAAAVDPVREVVRERIAPPAVAGVERAGVLEPLALPRRMLGRFAGRLPGGTETTPLRRPEREAARAHPEAAPATVPAMPRAPTSPAVVPPTGAPVLARAELPPAAARAHGDERTVIAMPPPVAPRRDPVTVGALRDAPSSGELRSASALAIPPAVAAPVAVAPVAATRPEIVIGRISVVVESPRPPAAAPRTVVRRVTTSAADGDGPAQRFGRFGLGQL